MQQSEFDAFADEYARLHEHNIRASGEGPEYFARYKAEMTARLLRGATVQRILDFGTGVGNSVAPLKECFPGASIDGIDVSTRSLEIAKARFEAIATFQQFDGASIPAEDGTFDLTFMACVLHHIDHSEHSALMREMRRVLKARGWLVIFEHNPYNLLTLHAVNTCEFDRNARLLRAAALKRTVASAGFNEINVHYCTFFPRFLRALRRFEPSLRWIPFGAQYCVVATR